MPLNSVKIGIDLVPIKNVAGCITFQADITSAKCLAMIKREIKHVKADVVLHDGAPNVGAEWTKDAYNQSELVLMAFKLATQLLRKDGIFVTKIFRSKDYATLLTVFKKLFKRVMATKPKASRSTSAEIFVVCTGYMAPSVVEPQLVDPKIVFSENLQDSKDNVTSLKQLLEEKRHRSGYREETSGFVYDKTKLCDFVKSMNPFQTLKNSTEFIIDEEAKEWLKELPGPDDIEIICKDVKVLGKRELSQLLKWRTKLLRKFAKDQVKEDQKSDLPPAPEKVLNEEEELDKFIEMREKKSTKTKKKMEKRIEKRKEHRREVEFAGEGNVDEDLGFDELLDEGDDIENIGYISLSDTDEEIEKQGFTAEEPMEDEDEDEAHIKKMNDEMEEFHQRESEMMNEKTKKKKRKSKKDKEDEEGLEDEEKEDDGDESEEIFHDVKAADKKIPESEIKVEGEKANEDVCETVTEKVDEKVSEKIGEKSVGFVNPLKKKIDLIVKETAEEVEEKKKIAGKRDKPEKNFEDDDDDIQGLVREKTDRDKRKEKKKKQRERLEKDGKVGKGTGFEEVAQEFNEGKIN